MRASARRVSENFQRRYSRPVFWPLWKTPVSPYPHCLRTLKVARHQCPEQNSAYWAVLFLGEAQMAMQEGRLIKLFFKK
jgi:hypothetical protein